MNIHFQEKFLLQWRQYFGNAELPIAYYYTDQPLAAEPPATARGARCLISSLVAVRQGRTFVYDTQSPGCPGGKRFSGFATATRPDFEYFLSCGIPGKMTGERYKQTPALARDFLAANPILPAPAQALVFKRWDYFTPEEQPLVVVFFASPDVLSGLFTLANFDCAAEAGVIAPMGAGCASILQYPLREATAAKPRCVLGMFDISARPCVPAGLLTFAVPMPRFEQLVAHMNESFLTTKAWQAVQARLGSLPEPG